MMNSDLVKQAENVLNSLRKSPDLVDVDDVVLAIEILPLYYPQTGRAIHMEGVHGAPNWLEHESMTWELSELVRSWLKAKQIAVSSRVLNAIARLVQDKRHAKGRQNFVLLLGEFGGSGYGATLEPLLGDPSVAGHVVKALLKSRTPGYAAPVQKLLSETRVGWIKQAAKKYLTIINEQERENA